MKLSICFMAFITCSLKNGCLCAPEPLCSKFSYDEQLLEKMIRMEFNVNNMEKSMHDAEEKILKTQKNMEGTLEKIENKIQLLEEKEAALIGRVNNTVRRTLEDTMIAFHAQEAADKSLASNQVIVFTKVNLNEGGSYDNTNGYFTASVFGIYHFTAHLCGETGKNVEYALLENDKKWTRGLYTAKDRGTCTSFSVTVQMKAGERAWVTIDNDGSPTTNILYEDSDDWNYFTGFLVRRMK